MYLQNGKFRIWAVDKIEDGIRILTGVPAGVCHKDGSFTKDSIFDRVQKRIKEFSKNTKKFSKDIDQSIKNSNNSKDDEPED